MPSHLPETALACKLPAAFDKSWSNGGWICGLLSFSLTAHRASSPSRQRGRRKVVYQTAGEVPGSPGACACPGPSISSGRAADEEELEGNIRALPASHLPAPKQAPSRWGPTSLHYTLVTYPTFLVRTPSLHLHTNFPNSAAA